MNVEDDRFCFVCGKDNPDGLQLTPETDPQSNSARIKVSIPKRFQGWGGIAHGGILSTLFDEAAIYACLEIAPQLVTAEMNLKYRKPVPVETPVEVSARVVTQDRRRLRVEGEICVDGEVCTRGEALIMILRGRA